MITQAKIKQHAERSAPGEEHKILSEGMVAHLGFCIEGRPYIIPTSYFYDPARPDRIYIHGAHSSRLMQLVCSGEPVCVEVTNLDGLVFSRSAKYHSMNYKSVVCFGRGRSVDQLEEKSEILHKAIERYFPGRELGRDYEAAPVEHLTSTSLAEIRIEEWSAKVREGGPRGPMDAKPGAPGTCGVVSTMRT